MARRYFSSIAEATTLDSSVSDSDTSITVDALVGYPSQLPWTAIIDRDTTDEEIVEVTGVAGTTVTVVRGVDGSTAKSHSSGAVFQHGVTGRDFEELNTYINTNGLAFNALLPQFYA